MEHELILTGGLGNQLFIVLEAVRRSFDTGRPILLNAAEYKVAGRADRPMVVGQLLPGLGQVLELATGISSQYRYLVSRMTRRLGVVRSKSIGLPGDAETTCMALPGWQTHSAYFQYFNGSELDLRALEFLRCLYLHEPIQSRPYCLALHVRRGDYLLAQHSVHGTVPLMSVLNEAILAIEIGKFEAVTVFTDSPEQIDVAVLSRLPVPFSMDEGGDPVAVFKRMAAHGGIVASNSSFSLWAALLGAPNYFSIPSAWMRGIDSTILGFPDTRRYQCTLS